MSGALGSGWPAIPLDEATGWASRFDMGALTRRRIVMHGAVLDRVLLQEIDGTVRPVSMVEWLRSRLTLRHNFERVIHYNHCEPPRVLAWGSVDLKRAQDELDRRFGGQQDRSDPVVVLPVLAEFLRQDRQNAAILENAGYRFSDPCLEAVLIRHLARESAGPLPPLGLAVHLYASENQIPQDFFTSDPDTAVILVAVPTYAERLAFLKHLTPAEALLHVQERGVEAGVERLARATEGLRLREMAQLIQLAGREPGVELNALLSQFRHGRKHDYWAAHRIEEIRDRLRSRVRGQDEAIEEVIQAMYRAKHRVSELINEGVRAPAMVLFFVGTTGVGKTFLARALAEIVAGSEENMKRFDMSEYRQEHSDQRLIGPPPGYLGHLEGGQLTNWVLLRPYSEVVFDEIEKAHPKTMDMFLQVLDGGRLTSGMGQTVDFTDTILIFTSNIGTQSAISGSFDRSKRQEVEGYYQQQVESYFRDVLGRPEIFNRLKQGIVVFNYISEQTAKEVIVRRLEGLAAAVGRRRPGLRVVFDPSSAGAKGVVAGMLKGTDFVTYGLRDVNNTLLRCVGGELARLLDDPDLTGDFRFEWDGGRALLVPGAPQR